VEDPDLVPIDQLVEGTLVVCDEAVDEPTFAVLHARHFGGRR
jgi:hypothetical protein